VALLPGCVLIPRKAEITPPGKTPPPGTRGVVFCADGAGGLAGTTHVLQHTVANAGASLQVEFVDWSHGTGRFLADHVHWRHIVTQGRQLTWQIQAWRKRYPDQRIYLMGHSAGCAVVLVAAAELPPDSVDRLILLAPSVAADYDLRPALASARHQAGGG
jgi:alpha-beta hydrolase superfamily lysophospholipase